MHTRVDLLAVKDVEVQAIELAFVAGKELDAITYLSRLSSNPVADEKFGLKVSHAFNYEGQELVPVGLNVIDGTRIDEGKLDETVFVVRDRDLVFNVNTQVDLELARNHRGG